MQTAAILLALAACGKEEGGPISVSAIGSPPTLANPNLKPLDPPSAFLVEATAQGLVRFDATGQIEPALAQSWIVSDDGLRYTFRLARTHWADGSKVTAEQVTQRLRAAVSRASRNPLKPLLGAIAEIETMTDEVLEVTLVGPRPNFLQILAQPELAVMHEGGGSGPFRAIPQPDRSVLLTLHRDDEEATDDHGPDVLLRGEGPARAVARFKAGSADLVTGGTIGDLALARAGDPGASLVFDPVAGLLGFEFAASRGLWANPAAREALSMTVDRAAVVAALGIPNLQPRTSLVPRGVDELPRPTVPAWAASPLPMRRTFAAGTLGKLSDGEAIVVRVAVPETPGYRLLFAFLRRDWRAIGVDAQRVRPGDDADLRLVDAVAPSNLASWYLRRFTCDASPVCSAPADAQLAAARAAPTAAERNAHLAAADQEITAITAFIPIAAPVRWSLVSPRLKGFQTNAFGRRFAGNLVRAPS